MTRKAALLSGLACSVLAVVLGAAVVWLVSGVPAVDQWWHDLVVATRTDAAVWIARVLNRVGGTRAGVVMTLVLIVIVLLVLRSPAKALFVAVAPLVSVSIVQLLKRLFGRMRPEDMLVTSDSGSFPSGHAANAATVAVIVCVLFPRLWVVLVAGAYAAAMGLSRTVVSAHWLSDIAGGMLLGSGIVLLIAAAMWPWLHPRPPASSSVTAEDAAR